MSDKKSIADFLAKNKDIQFPVKGDYKVVEPLLNEYFGIMPSNDLVWAVAKLLKANKPRMSLADAGL
jgi:hypothetical protein